MLFSIFVRKTNGNVDSFWESVNISAINREKKQCKGALNGIINASFCVSGNFFW